jgi:hypothetical protein
LTPKNVQLRAEWTRTHAWTCRRVLEHFTISCRAYYLGKKTAEHAAIFSWGTLVPRTDKDAVEAIRMVAINAMDPDKSLKLLVEHRLRWSWGKFARARHRAAHAICLQLNARRVPVERRLETAGVVCGAGL